ncbi:unnamed protein product [Absidia cylindrospora]
MTTGSKQNIALDSFVRKVLKGQQVLQIQLDNVQRQLHELQHQLRPLRDVSDQLRQLSDMPLQLQQLLGMQTQIRKLLLLEDSLDDTTTPLRSQSLVTPPNKSTSPIPSESLTSISSRLSRRSPSTVNSDEDDTIIPWPRGQARGRTTKLAWALVRKKHVTDAIEQHILQHITINFGQENINTNDEKIYSLFIYNLIAEVTNSICAKELQQGHYGGYTNLPGNIQERLKNRIDLKLMGNSILIGKAEDQWIIQYFIRCYLKNIRTRNWILAHKRKNNKGAQKRRRRTAKKAVPSTSTAATTTPTSSLSPPSSSSYSSTSTSTSTWTSTYSPTSVKKARTERLPVVISENQDDDDSSDN